MMPIQQEPLFDDTFDVSNMPPPPPNFDNDFVYDGSIPNDEADAYELPASPFAGMNVMPQHTGAMDLSAARTLLKQVFGYDELRPLQPEVIQNVLNKKDSLAIMPTGSGKSICYQLPALMFSGLTVVVSPLISLMEDQVAQLRELGVTAVYLNSTLHPQQQDEIAAQVRAGIIKLLYAAPETLMRPGTMRLLQESAVDCLTIDEAHCISEWGHDFRPEYRQLVELRRRLPNAICLSVTATATDRVRQDIKRSLAIPDAGEFIASFDRPNLFLAVEPKMEGLRQTLSFLDAYREEAGIIYCSTRKQVDSLTSDLAANGWPVLPYHAGLDAATRQRNQHRFTREEAIVMVATVAFGMGIDKSNVRFIVHYDLPKNLESYYQQIGRAGRDGLPSNCLLLFSYSDVSTINYFISQKAPDQQQGARMRLDGILQFVETAVCRRKPLL
ncbi:MAG: ATP-dependent DNA helicase RecQ, partial [Chloroflexi bacterium]|nr:ATP-dependent DNA helicase RecQ [Chloroflexota bacterium]